jgi:hypothetical protein
MFSFYNWKQTIRRKRLKNEGGYKSQSSVGRRQILLTDIDADGSNTRKWKNKKVFILDAC